MILHIQAMMNSMVSVQTQSKYVIDDLRLTYPFLGEIARWFCQRLEQLCGILMGRDDEDFILPLFISAWGTDGPGTDEGWHTGGACEPFEFRPFRDSFR